MEETTQPIIISDATPLIALAKIGYLHLFPKLFGQVIIPEAVYEEVTQKGNRVGATDVKVADWIEVRAVTDYEKVTLLLSDLNAGEAESIILAQEVKATRLLIDEHKGRAIAKRMGLPVIGTVGIIILAKEVDLIDSVKPFLDQLLAEGIHLSRRLVSYALRVANES